MAMAGATLPTIVVVDSDKSAEDQLRTMITLYRPPEVEKRIMGTKAKAVGAVLRGRKGSRKAAGEADRAGEDTGWLLLYCAQERACEGVGAAGCRALHARRVKTE